MNNMDIKTVLQDLREEVSCPVCTGIYTDPKQLEAVARNKPWPRHNQMSEMSSTKQTAGKWRFERSTDQSLPEQPD